MAYGQAERPRSVEKKDWSWWETDMMVGWDEIYPHDPNLKLHAPDKMY